MHNFFLSVSFYCFRKGSHISFKYARHNHSRCPMMGEVSHLKRSPLKHTCLWRDRLIVLSILNRQAKMFLRISKETDTIQWKNLSMVNFINFLGTLSYKFSFLIFQTWMRVEHLKRALTLHSYCLLKYQFVFKKTC